MTVPNTAPTCFAVNDGIAFPGLAVADASTLYLYNLQFGFDLCKHFLLPEQPVCMSWMKDYICVSFKDEYSLVSEASGTVHELANTDGAAPLCRSLPMEEMLVVTKNGALITQPGKWKISAYKLSGPIRSLSFSFPYMFALSSKGSDLTVEIRSVLDVTYHEVLRLQSFATKHAVALADDNLNVYAMDLHHLYSILPIYNSNANQNPSSDADRDKASSITPGRTPPTRTHSPSVDSSLQHMTNQESTASIPTSKERRSSGLFSFKTTIAGSPSVATASPLRASTGVLDSTVASPAPQGASVTSSPRVLVPTFSTHHIPPPAPNDKNGFIRYIRTVLKQEFNPYRILLSNYAANILAEHPNFNQSKTEEVKKCVSQYLRRFSRTFGLEFKQFTSKTLRDLFGVAISIALHSQLYTPVYSLIQTQCDEQDKSYNAKLLALHHMPFTPAHFEVRPKFWLTEASILAEQEKARRSSEDNGKPPILPAVAQEIPLSKEETRLNRYFLSNAPPGSDDGNSSSTTDGEEYVPTSSPPGSRVLTSTEPMALNSSSENSSLLLRPNAKQQITNGTSPQSITTNAKSNPKDQTDKSRDSTAEDGKFVEAKNSTAPAEDPSQTPSPNVTHSSDVSKNSIATKNALNGGNSQPQVATPVSDPTLTDSNDEQDQVRSVLGVARLYSMPKVESDDFIGQKFVLLDGVQVAHDSEHHLYFTFEKDGKEKELATTDWNFTFKDEERSVYWVDSISTTWRLTFSKKQAYLEFTTRYRLYEQQQQAAPAVLAPTMGQSFTSASFLSSVMGGGPGNGLASSGTMLVNNISGSRLSMSSTALERTASQIDFSSPSSIALQQSTSDASLLSSDSSPKLEPTPTTPLRDSQGKRTAAPDLRRIALEQSAAANNSGALGTPTGIASNSPRADGNLQSPSAGVTPTQSPMRTNSGPSSTRDYPYCAAIRTLRLVPKQRTPREKIETMARALSYVAQAVDEFWGVFGKKVIVGADDLVPIFSYVVAMARVPNMYSEMSYTMEFSNESSLRGKYGYSIATLQICVEHVLQVSAQLEAELKEKSNPPALNPVSSCENDDPSPTPTLAALDPTENDFSSSPHSSFKGQKFMTDLMGKMESMSNMAGKLREAEDAFERPSSQGKVARSDSTATSPSLTSPEVSRPSTPSPPTSVAVDPHATSPPGSPSDAQADKILPSKLPGPADPSLKYACSALEVSQPQIEGHLWIGKGMLQFEGIHQKAKRAISLEISTIIALKKSWGMFGGDGIDIYAKQDRIIFLRHMNNSRDHVYEALHGEIVALGLSIPMH